MADCTCELSFLIDVLGSWSPAGAAIKDLHIGYLTKKACCSGFPYPGDLSSVEIMPGRSRRPKPVSESSKTAEIEEIERKTYEH